MWGVGAVGRGEEDAFVPGLADIEGDGGEETESFVDDGVYCKKTKKVSFS